jgi:hypothetical protein
MKLLFYLIPILTFCCNCSLEKKETVTDYLINGNFIETKVFGDTFINYNSKNKSIHYVDKKNEILYLSINNISFNGNLIMENTDRLTIGKTVFTLYCASCHNDMLKNIRNYDILNFENKYQKMIPEIKIFGKDFFYALYNKNYHSQYFLLPKKTRENIFFYLKNKSFTPTKNLK